MRTTAQVCQSTWDNSRILSKILYVLRFLLFFFSLQLQCRLYPNSKKVNDLMIALKFTLSTRCIGSCVKKIFPSSDARQQGERQRLLAESSNN